MITKKEHKRFYIFDYFLDGEFLKWEEVNIECPACGDICSISLDDGAPRSIPKLWKQNKLVKTN